MVKNFEVSPKFQKSLRLQWSGWGMTLGLLIFLGIWMGIYAKDKCVAGLILNLIGVCITFIFAWPSVKAEDNYSKQWEKGTPVKAFPGDNRVSGDCEAESEKMMPLKRAWSVVGLLYLIVGIAFQLWHQVLTGELR